MPLIPLRWATRSGVLTVLCLALSACDDDATLEPAGRPPELVAFAGGIPIGTFGLPNSEFGDRYNGAHRNIHPDDLLASLDAIQARGGRVILVIAGGPNQYKDAEGHFSLALWKSRVNRYAGIDFSAYIQDGTVHGHYLVDEPNDPANWNGVPIPGDTVEAMAQYSKQLWPDLPTVVRVDAAYLAESGTAYRYLDAAWAQYVARKGEVDDFLQRNVADAQSLGLELVVGFNLLAGGPGGVPLTAAQVRDWGAVLLSSSYPCAFVSWKYDATYLASAEMGSAMDDLRGRAQARGTKSCRSAGGSPSPEPDPTPLATTTRIEADTPDPSAPGQAITVRVAVSASGATPPGSVNVTASGGDESCTAVLSDGIGTCTLALATAGQHTLTAGYPGNATFASSSDADAHGVQSGSADVVISWAEPQDITYGTALGSAQLNASATAGGQPVAGSLTYNPAAGTVLNAGEDQDLKATFTPDDPKTYEADSAAVRLDVLRAPTTLALDPSSLTYTYNGQPRGARFTVTPASVAGSVTLAYSLGDEVVSAPTNAGAYQVTATLPASTNYEGARADGNFTINPATPSVTWSVPASTLVGPLSASLLTASASGAGGAAVQGTFTYSPAAGQFLDAQPSRTLSVSFQPSSANYTAGTRSVSLAVLYPWSGFFEPTNNPQVLNRAKAGTAIPVRFSLGGNQPSPVLASGSPEVRSVSCPNWSTDAIEQTVSASGSSLRYESSTGQYVYTWKTQASWAGGCRRLRLVLKDGTRHEAIFRFVQ